MDICHVMKSACSLLMKKVDREIWRRGERYALASRVEITSHDETQILAVVRGTQRYKVSVRFAPNGISQKCDCPYFAGQGYVCKHIVAVAIVWDEKRGISPPATELVEIATVPPPKLTRKEIGKLFRKPLTADLDQLRILAEETALGGRARPHSRLPKAPKMNTSSEAPLSIKEIGACLTEIRSWSRRKRFDPYFCSGEMVAAFCELLRVIAMRLPVSDKAEAAHILMKVQEFNVVMVTGLIDDSQGIRVFTEAHLEDIHNQLMKLDRDAPGIEVVHRLLKGYERRRGEYY
jgi:hypothetical protein